MHRDPSRESMKSNRVQRDRLPTLSYDTVSLGCQCSCGPYCSVARSVCVSPTLYDPLRDPAPG